MAPKKKPDDEQAEDDEVEFSEAQIAKIGAIINSTVTTQLGRKLDAKIADAIKTPMEEIKELFKKQAPAGAAPSDDEPEDEEPAKPKGKAKPAVRGPDPAVAAMQRELAAMKEERAKEKATMAARERDGTIREHLTKAGVKPELMRGAISVLRESTKLDEKTGEWLFLVDRGDYQDELDIGAGAKHWLSTDEGKAHIAVPERQLRGGAGTRVTPTTSPTRTQPISDPKQAKAAKVQEAMAQLADAAGAIGGPIQ